MRTGRALGPHGGLRAGRPVRPPGTARHLARLLQHPEQHSCSRQETMNIVTRLAIIEQLLEEAPSERNERPDVAPLRRPSGEGRRLVDELDQAQMLKAAAYFRPSRHAGAW